jgi:membrane protein required for colicin V production
MSAGLIDLTILFIVGVSVLIGILRGATREVLGIAGWVGAFITVFYGLPLFRPLGRQYIQNPMIADAAVGGVLFILSLGIFILFSRTISSGIKGSPLNGLDRTLGLVFGFVRGLVLVCLLYLALGFFYPPNSLPQVFEQARLIGFVNQGALALKQIIPTSYLPDERHLLRIEDLDVLQNKTLPSMEETVRNLSTLKPISPSKTLDSLIERNDTASQQ